MEERVFSRVGCLSLSGFEEISKAVFEAGTSLTEKAEQGRKRSQNVYAPMLRVLSCLTNWQSLVGSVSRNEERESAISVSKFVRERERERESVCVCVRVCVCVCVCAVSVYQNMREWVLGRREYI